MVVTRLNLVSPFSDQWWSMFWKSFLWLYFIISLPVTVWFTIGGIHDIKALYRDLDRLVQSEAPLVFLFHNRGFVAHAPRLRGVQAHLLLPPVRWNELWLEP